MEPFHHPSTVIALKGQHILAQGKWSRNETWSKHKRYLDRATLGKGTAPPGMKMAT